MSMKLMVAAMAARVGNPLRKLVLIKLADQANDQGECWPSFAHIADQCEMSRRSVIGHIKALEVLGFLTTERRAGEKGNSSNVYHLHIHKAAAIQAEKEQKGSANAAPPPSAGDSPPLVQEVHQGSANAAPPLVQELHPESVSFESVIESKDKPPLSPCGEKDQNMSLAGDRSNDPAPAKKPRRKTQLPDDFVLTSELREAAVRYWLDPKRCRSDLDADDEFGKFVAHHRARGTTMLRWDAAWQTWYTNAVKFNQPPRGAANEIRQSALSRRSELASHYTDFDKATNF